MRRITIALMSTVSALVALFSYHTSTGSGGVAGAPSDSSTDGSTDTSTGTSSGTSPGTAGAASGSASGSGETYTGDAVDTRWGVVQVRITVADGRITAAEAVRYPTENPRDQQINAYAVPQLDAAAVQAQGGDIDAVSGATVTSDGYVESLQSAIDKANL